MKAERGAASLALLGVVGFALALASGMAGAAAIWDARAQASGAADAAALAAAPVTFRPFGARSSPVAEARRFAAANGARLVGCACRVDRSWRPRWVEVTVARDIRVAGLGRATVTARATAEFRPLDLLRP